MAIRELTTYTRNSYNKKVNTTYVYQVTEYLNEETQERTLKRKVIGKMDPDTGNVIPTTRKRASSPPEVAGVDYKAKYEDLLNIFLRQEEHNRTIYAQLTAVLNSTTARFQEISRATDKAVSEINRLIELISDK